MLQSGVCYDMQSWRWSKVLGRRQPLLSARGRRMAAALELDPALDGDAVIDRPVKIGGEEYRVTCLSVGNPHCVVFTDHPEKIDLSATGPQFEFAPLFPERINTEFVRVVSPTVLSMRVYERGNGETAACGTGAVAAAVAAVLNGYCKKDVEITVELPGGDLSVCVREDGDVILTGDAHLIYTGVIVK
jgi:carbamoyl-phosphate synthase large subunit